MKKLFSILFVLTIAFFTLPFSGNTVLADGKSFDDIEAGDYEIGVEAFEVKTEEHSAADGFLINEATLSINNDDIKLVLHYTKDFSSDYGINWTKLERNSPIVEQEDESAYSYTFQVDKIKQTYQASMNYYVPGLPGDMGDKEKGHSVDYRIMLDESDLNELPVKSDDEESEDDSDKEKPEKAPEEREVGTLLTEKEADAVYELKYETESKATAGQLENPVKLLEKDNKKYIQIPIKESGAQFFRSLKINGKEVTWNSITEGPYTIQFELNNGIEEELDLSMVIQAGPRVMPHDNIKLNLDKDSLKTIKESNNEENTDQPNDNPEKNEKPNTNEDKEDERNKEDKNNKDSNTKLEKDEKSKQEEKSLVPDKAYEVDYVIKNATKDETSAADNFFIKPGYLFEKDGVNYVQLTVTNSDMIDNLKTANGDVIIVKKNSDGSMVVQFKVGNDLSEAVLLNMHITVPGMYSSEHDARLFLDEGSLKEISADKHALVASDNGNGPHVKGAQSGDTLGGKSNDENNSNNDNKNNGSDNTGKRVHSDTPAKPDLSSDKDGAATAASKSDKAQNPQTGDTSSILLYSLLLIGSLIPLARKFKGRFI